MKKIASILDKAASNSRLHKMDTYTQHGDTSTLMHTIAVAHYSVKLARKLRLPVHKRELVRGALLHDYFLYDWHDKRKGSHVHGFTHPNAALQNADKDFTLSKRERDIIGKHMFPLTPKPPTTREAWLVCLVDKFCSVKETFGKDPYKGMREELKNKHSDVFAKMRMGAKRGKRG